MADGEAVQFDFSDLGGQRVGQALDFSDLGGQRVEQSDEQQAPGGFFDKFGSLGTLSVESHPEWVKGWRASAGPSPQPQKPTLPTSPNHQAKPLDFSDIGGRRVSVPTSHVSQQTDGHDFSSSTEARLGQAAQPQPQKSTWGQLADLNNAINDAEMRTVVGAGNDLWGTVQGIGSLFEPPDFMRHPIEQRPKTLGEAISQGAQAGAYATGLTTVGRAVKGYYDATQQNMDRLHQAADKGDTAGVLFNSAAVGLPLVGPMIGGLYEDAQTNPDPFAVIGKGISRVGQTMSMAPERSFIPNPVSALTKGVGRVLSKVGDGPHVSPVGSRIATTSDVSPETAELEQTPAGTLAEETPKSAGSLDAGKYTRYADRAAARKAFAGKQQAAANRFYKDATSKSTGFKSILLENGGQRMEFFSPANNPGYGKLYVQEIDSDGNWIREYKDTIGPNGLINRKWVHKLGEP